MFRRRPDGRSATIAVTVEGRTVMVPEGASAAAAVLLAGLPSLRTTAIGGSERAPYCLMGVCFDCLAEIDDVPNRQSCMTLARPGMRIQRQRGCGESMSPGLLRRCAPRNDAVIVRHCERSEAIPRRRGTVAMTADLAIVGAGPAGMAAAVLASELGLDTLLIDQSETPGGQLYRGVEQASDTSPLGPDYLAGRRLVAALRASTARYCPGTTVWHIDPDAADGAVLSVVADGVSETIAARQVLLATGAIERPVPIPGWTLPGVMTVGAAQILMKSADLVPEGRAVLAGQGPLLYLVATQLARAGAPPLALLETTPPQNYRAAARHAGSWWAGRHELAQAAGWFLALRRAGVKRWRGVRGLRALGRQRLEGIAWDGGAIATDLLLLHEGVIPDIQISLGLQLAHRWDDAQRCWRPVLDEWGCSSVPNVAIAGDSGGIAGGAAAALSGRLAALDAARRLGRFGEAERDHRASPIRVQLRRAQALRPFLDALYQPADAVLDPADGVIVCRCEEVTAGEIRRAVRLGAAGPNQVKAFLRCGMGPCQGRICGSVVSAVVAAARGVPIAEIGNLRPRAPYKPITVGTLAGT